MKIQTWVQGVKTHADGSIFAQMYSRAMHKRTCPRAASGQVGGLVIETKDQKNMQIGIATSVVIHAVLLFVFAWFIGLDHHARELWKAAQALVEEPQVTMIAPEQVTTDVDPTLTPEPEPPQAEPIAQLSADPRRVFVETTGKAAPEAPAMPTLISDRNTKATTRATPSPASNVALPATRPPIEVAKAQPTPMAELMRQVDNEAPNLELEVRKPTEPAAPNMRVADDFVPTTEPSPTKDSSIETKGDDEAADAVQTPFARYAATVIAAVRKHWDPNRVTINGAGLVRFIVRRDGSTQELPFEGGAREERVGSVLREAIRRATIPPIPADVLALWPEGQIPVEFTIEPQ